MEAIVVAAISACATIAVALINARAIRQRSPVQTLERAGSGDDTVAEPEPEPERPDAVRRFWARLWALFGRLPPLEQRGTAWVAAFVGFLFGGFGIALYFRRQADVLVGLVFVIPLVLATRGEGEETTFGWWYWPFATLAAIYCLLRVESTNRRLEAEAEETVESGAG